jgi:20S proteasome alpha/beta subunit
MTICIVGICDSVNGTAKTAIAIADRMVTAGDTEFEQAAFSKITRLTENCVVLSAGSALVPTELFNATRSKFSGMPAPSIFEIVQEIKRNFVRLRTIRAEERYFRPLGLTVKDFLENQRSLDNTLVVRLSKYLEDARLGGQAGLQILVAGRDSTGSHIHFVADPGTSECFDSIGYCSIGSGERHADSALIVNDYHIAQPLNKALYLIYEAKKRAEVAPGVGRMYTDVTIISDTGIINLTADQIKELQKVFDKHTEVEEKCRSEMEEIIQGIPNLGGKKT